jgi:hypothetical protein
MIIDHLGLDSICGYILWRSGHELVTGRTDVHADHTDGCCGDTDRNRTNRHDNHRFPSNVKPSLDESEKLNTPPAKGDEGESNQH